MDKLVRYRSLLKQFLQERAGLMNSHPIDGIDTLCLFDEARDEYLIYNVGWQHRNRVRYVTLLTDQQSRRKFLYLRRLYLSCQPLGRGA